MFNEILTGKQSIENKPPAVDAGSPYRAPAELPPMLQCPSCQEAFPTSQAVAGKCRACAPRADQALASMGSSPQGAYVDLYEEQRKRAFNQKAFSIAIAILIALGFAVFKYGMRAQIRADREEAAGHRSSTGYSPYDN